MSLCILEKLTTGLYDVRGAERNEQPTLIERRTKAAVYGNVAATAARKSNRARVPSTKGAGELSPVYMRCGRTTLSGFVKLTL
jgi:hypothetical protein